ncbi:MAG: hypothetical protein AAF492_01280 [Verrucomicrobiota bacterium]
MLKKGCKWGGLILASLTVSFFFNWAIAPWAYLPDADDYDGPEMPKDVRGQLEHFYWIWSDPERREQAHEAMQAQNPEWDMVARAFWGYSLANVALAYPEEKEKALRFLDLVIDDSVARPWTDFLLPYGRARPFVRQPASSVMVDGEFSLMIGLRRLIEDPTDYKHRELHRDMIERCVASMKDGPLLTGECYPDECWLWCNPLALVSVKVFDLLEGTDHSDLIEQWSRIAQTHLLDKTTGLMNSAVTLDGKVIHKPEGSTIWIGAYCLDPILPEFARSQYETMKELLAGDFVFLQFGREWPRGTEGSWDIDSGFTPLGMGPASTGFALVAAKQMGDHDFFRRLLGLLDLVGVPRYEEGRMRYLSSNLVGDATFLLAKTSGPAWAEIKRRAEEMP